MTKIEWTHRPGTVPVTWNVTSGCTPVSPECDHCWARRMAKRLAGRCGYPEAPREFDVTLHEDKLLQPYGWEKLRTVFVTSMGDLFHDRVPEAYIYRVLDVAAKNDRHLYMFLTKRAERLAFVAKNYCLDRGLRNGLPSHFWLGVTAGNQEMFDRRWAAVSAIPAAVLWVSSEPLLGPIDFSGHERKPDWFVVGGETGPGARPMRPAWARSVRDQCQASGIPFFFKSWGNWKPAGYKVGGIPHIPQYSTASFDPKLSDCFFGDGEMMLNVGKKAAGDLLDGVQYHEWPEARK